MKQELKIRIRTIIEVVFPRLWYYHLRNSTYKTNLVVNDLTIYPQLSIAYDPTSTYVTMFSKPPKHYENTIKARTFDQDGIPLYKGKYYNLVQIAQYGLTEFGYYKSTGKKEHLHHAQIVCDWLIRNQEKETGYWIYRFEYPHIATGYMLNNWACAMGQGQAVSLLTRMWHLNHNDQYLDVAQNAFKMFDVPVANGGLLAMFENHMVYEEYPTDPPSFTLNGMIFATFGLYDYLQIKKNDRVQQLFNEALLTIEYMLPFYDDDILSNYDLSHITARLRPKIKGDKYHIIHIALLQNLYSISPRPTFEYYIKKWAKMSGFNIK